MIAGGASGMVAISHELGADARLVATMQYLRVVIVFGSIPIVAGVLYGASSADTRHGPAEPALLSGSLTVLAIATTGVVLARLVRLPTGALLGPMLLAAALSLTAPWHLGAPPLVKALALAGIGLSVGVRFSARSLRDAGQILPAALTAIVAMIAICALVGAVLAQLAHVSQLAGYLATSPGGLPVVLGTAVTTDAEGTFVVSLQVLRVFLMLLIAPLLARLLISHDRRVSDGDAYGS
jgi:membrane AbrB-like protein